MSQTLVLSVGVDPAVLETRDLILRSAGYIVVSAVSVEEAFRFFGDGDFDIIVLCHTLHIKDCERLSGLIRASGSRIPIACVQGTGFCQCNPFANALLDKDPAALLEGLGDLLSDPVPIQSAGISVSYSDGGVNLAKRAPRSSTEFGQDERAMRDHEVRRSFLERVSHH